MHQISINKWEYSQSLNKYIYVLIKIILRQSEHPEAAFSTYAREFKSCKHKLCV